MTTPDTTTDTRSFTIDVTREFAAPPDRVYHRWTNADALARWFAPPTYRTVRAEADPQQGGAWRLDFASDTGEHRYTERGVFRELDAGTRVVLTLEQVDGEVTNPETLVTVALDDIGTAEHPRTRMRFTQTGYTSLALRNDNEEGWLGCFTSLDRDLQATDGEPDERELRELFEAWYDASTRKDVAAQMEPIADDIVSYEHDAPQEYRGVEAVRAVCQAGMEYQTGDFRWDIPDLQIRIAGDIAVTWGLNRMRNVAADGAVREDWSRGTRIFERRDGRWQMIHQHVSFPVDAEGRASTER